MFCYIPFVYSRPDVWIAKYNLSQEEVTWEDISYLIYNGSYDTIPVIAEAEYPMGSAEDEIAYQMDEFLKDGENGYVEASDMKLKQWNYSEYQARKAARAYLNQIHGSVK